MQRASRKSDLDSTAPSRQDGRTVSHDETPFSATISRRNFWPSDSWSLSCRWCNVILANLPAFTSQAPLLTSTIAARTSSSGGVRLVASSLTTGLRRRLGGRRKASTIHITGLRFGLKGKRIGNLWVRWDLALIWAVRCEKVPYDKKIKSQFFLYIGRRGLWESLQKAKNRKKWT